jgi:ubiquinone biosynthesis protein UbiJ
MLPLPFLPDVSRLACGALNALLGREEWARERLSRHAGKTVRFASGSRSLSLAIGNDGLVDTADPAIVPDVTLTLRSDKLNPLSLFSQGMPDFAEITHIAGDAALAQVVGDLARDLRWEPQDDLAKVVGDIPAQRLTAGARALASGARSAGGRLAANVAEYLAEERPVLAGKPVLDQQRQDVARLQADLDSLERGAAQLRARLARLEGSAARP